MYARGKNDAPSISKYGSLVRLDTQIVALCAKCAKCAPKEREHLRHLRFMVLHQTVQVDCGMCGVYVFHQPVHVVPGIRWRCLSAASGFLLGDRPGASADVRFALTSICTLVSVHSH